MKKVLIASFLMLAGVIFTSCSDDNEDPVPPAPLEEYVYIVGTKDNSNGKYASTLWKNGEVTELSSNDYTAAISVAVSGADVYVAEDYSTSWPGLSINGTKKQLSSNGNANATSVTVSGADVYVVGQSGAKAVIWKNDDAVIQLPSTGTSAFAYSVTVSGADVYVGGYDGDDAALWKNEIKQLLPTTRYGKVNSIAVSGSDVYAAGVDNGKAVLWKNRTKQELSNAASEAVSVGVLGSDVYVVGVNDGKAVLWKNDDAAIELSSKISAASSVVVSESNVYIVFSERYTQTPKNKYAIKLWKNGEVSNITEEDGTNAKSYGMTVVFQ